MPYSALSTTSAIAADFNKRNNHTQSEPSSDHQQQQQQQYTQHESPQAICIYPVSTAAATIFSSNELAVENVMPGIYLTKNFIVWNEENLRTHGFTHIIIIDKHIKEFYYPSPVFKLPKKSESISNAAAFDCSPFEYATTTTTSATRTSTATATASSPLSFGKEFEAIDLNFGEKSYLTTVLPNCYRAVKFINKALQAGGTILIIDCNGGEQKCLTIIVAYLMYKENISFSDAFARLKRFYKKADLDRFYCSQLYEYEPILQVQRAQSRGHSCSRKLLATILKRKYIEDDAGTAVEYINNDGGTNQFFQTLNPLSQFNAAAQQLQQHRQNHHHQQQEQQQQRHTFKHTTSNGEIVTTAAAAVNGATRYNDAWDDYEME